MNNIVRHILSSVICDVEDLGIKTAVLAVFLDYKKGAEFSKLVFQSRVDWSSICFVLSI